MNSMHTIDMFHNNTNCLSISWSNK